MSLIKNRRNSFSAIPALVDDFLGRELFNWDNSHFSSTQTTVPAVNILESADNFTVEVAAPGMEKQDFKIELENNTLTISSQKQQNEQTEQGNYTRREFSYQSFHRTFILPRDVVNDEGIAARYENGVLHLIIPKKEEVKQKAPRLIEIR
ncbi:Hsp20/alpha crystallin family protein [Dyadobacter sp. CY326]|uniref:Hsp20/alpha crystallin family protein n=1 Tax=Dyadobacter sp. CY326 TaxID=2907300 RepID=UPI001F4894FE|nr:Hsp20/alpha crystallin family protein [Dyadobacter sp. CY326]MCE7067092.1 Hsp20/alpha crystallin family protein [Dyadobacter sp. CY326]